MSIGKKIKMARNACGLTQKELGERLGVKQQTIAMFENNKTNIKHSTLEKIADALGITLDFLLQDKYATFAEYEKNHQYPVPISEGRWYTNGIAYNNTELLALADMRVLDDNCLCILIDEFIQHYRFHQHDWKYPNLGVGDYYKIYDYIDYLIYMNDRNGVYHIYSSPNDEDGEPIQKDTWEDYYYKESIKPYLDMNIVYKVIEEVNRINSSSDDDF